MALVSLGILDLIQIQEIKIQILASYHSMALSLIVKTTTSPVVDIRGGISILEGTSRIQITRVGLETQNKDKYAY